MRTVFAFIFLITIFIDTPWANASGCNGSEDLCARRYDQVVYPTTHNATSVTFDDHPVFFIPNQEKGVDFQLRDGIRAFMIDAWYYNGVEQRRHRGEVYACHVYCALGGKPLVGVLNQMREFLEANPNEVLTIIFESYVSSADMAFQFANAGLLKYVETFPLPVEGSAQAWPTLAEMIRKDKRMVVFTDNQDHGPSWYMNAWDYAVETPYTYKNVNQFTCNYNRGKSENPLYILNHFLTKALFRHAFSRKPNKLNRLLSRADKCFKEKQKIPNFLTVDFYRSSKVVEAAAILNKRFTAQFKKP